VNPVNYRKYDENPVFQDDQIFFLQNVHLGLITTLNIGLSPIRKHVSLAVGLFPKGTKNF
jgi:hypothetical protein